MSLSLDPNSSTYLAVKSWPLHQFYEAQFPYVSNGETATHPANSLGQLEIIYVKGLHIESA